MAHTDAVPGSVASDRRVAPLLAVVLDHAHARLFLVDGEHVAELSGLVSPRMRGGKFHSDRQGSPGWGEAGFHRRRREEERRHYAAIVRRLGAVVAAHQPGGLFIGGSAPVVAAFRRALPPRQSKLVVGTARLNPLELTAAQLLTGVRPARRAGGLVHEQRLVDAAVEGFGSGDAVDGLRAVLRAVARDQVRTLLVARRSGRPAWRSAKSGRVVLTKAEALGESVIRVPDVISAAAAQVRQLGGTVVEIGNARQAARIDGVAALLRYRLEESVTP